MNIELCPSPALYPIYKSTNDTVIIVDVFRASATICAMLQNGATAVIPVADIDTAKSYKQKGYLVGAERKAVKCDFADFGNSPFDYTSNIVNNREVVFTTTNGTRAITIARDAKELIVGTFTNIDAVINHTIKQATRVVIIAAGWNNKVSIEDTLFAGAFVERTLSLIKNGNNRIVLESDSIKMAYDLWLTAKDNLLGYLKKSDHYQRLINNGAEGDIEYCITPNLVTVLPIYNKESYKLTLPNQKNQSRSFE
jgi:2-phosphosulfolactate phosphatase